MSQFDLIAVPQSRAGAIMELNNPQSVLETARFGAPRRESLSFVGSAVFCRPRS